MGKEIYIRFDDDMVRAQKNAVAKNWEDFKSIMMNRKELLSMPFDLFGNTPIHAVARAGNGELLRELLQNLYPTEQMEALTRKNHEDNTLLHEVVLLDDPDMVDMIINEFDKKLKGYNDDDEVLSSLLDELNDHKETPAFRAAKYGKLRVLKRLLTKHHLNSMHFPPGDYGGDIRPVLRTCVLTFNFDAAVWLLEKVNKDFAKEKFKHGKNNEEEHNEGKTCLNILSKMPDAFKSTNILQMGVTERII